jgi:quercetin dioxygenase-like cupin family protein
MKLKFQHHFFLVSAISFSLMACNNDDKKAEEPKAEEKMVTAPAATPPSAAAATEEKIDAVTAAPNLYKLVQDTLGIRILEATYKPGDSSVLHSHPVNAMYVIQGGTAEFKLKDGSKMSMEMKAGMSGVRGYDLHSVKNTGKTTLKVLVVEVSRPANMITLDAATDPAKVAPDNYKVVHDSLGIRIIEVNYKPGQTSPFHAHPGDYAIYVVEGGSAELTSKDGKKTARDVKTGMAWVNPADSHSGKNTGKKPFKLMMFEVDRARN